MRAIHTSTWGPGKGEGFEPDQLGLTPAWAALDKSHDLYFLICTIRI